MEKRVPGSTCLGDFQKSYMPSNFEWATDGLRLEHVREYGKIKESPQHNARVHSKKNALMLLLYRDGYPGLPVSSAFGPKRR